MTSRIQMTSVVLSLAVAVALAGCGGDDDSAERDRDEPTTTETTARTTTTTTTVPGTTPDGSAPAPATGLPGDVGTQLEVDRVFTGEGSEEFCAQVQALQESVTGSDPSQIDEASVTGQMAGLTPPAEIAGDWNMVVSVQQGLVDAPAEDPFAGIDQAQLDAYGQSSAVIAAYLGDVCQLSLME
jgi:hypothetical protein